MTAPFVLVRRSGALGDVVLATVVTRALRRMLDAQGRDATEIHVVTLYPEVFNGNPDVRLYDHQSQSTPCVGQIDLDLAYEKHPDLHIVDVYLAVAEIAFPGIMDFTHTPTGRQQFIKPSILPLPCTIPPRAVALHMPVSPWKSRTISSFVWSNVLAQLAERGYVPVILGTGNDLHPLTHHTLIDLHAGTTGVCLTPRKLVSIIDRCVCFIGSDSGLLHIAGATSTPIVGLFTCAAAYRRLPYRADPSAAVGIDAAVPCAGCRARMSSSPPLTHDACLRAPGDQYVCANAFDPRRIVEAVDWLVTGRHHTDYLSA